MREIRSAKKLESENVNKHHVGDLG